VNRILSFVIPSVPGISYFTALTSATYVVLPKENHTHLTEAATLDRKSGGAEGSAVSLDGNQPEPKRHLPHCHPDRSEAERRDLRFPSTLNKSLLVTLVPAPAPTADTSSPDPHRA
jgi:hypothetical protein